MKADVLSIFKEINICTSYQWKGENIDYFPYDCQPHQLTPNYITLPGWNQSLTDLQDEKDFPVELKGYIQFIEKLMEIPITLISVGPDRKQTILRQPWKERWDIRFSFYTWVLSPTLLVKTK